MRPGFELNSIRSHSRSTGGLLQPRRAVVRVPSRQAEARLTRAPVPIAKPDIVSASTIETSQSIDEPLAGSQESQKTTGRKIRVRLPSAQRALKSASFLLISGGVGMLIMAMMLGYEVTPPSLTPQISHADDSSRHTSDESVQSTNTQALTTPTAADIYGYRRAADLPKRLEIPQLGVVARVLDVGNDRTGHVGVPVSLYDVAWYTNSSKPMRASGSSLIVGHIGTAGLPGVFQELHTIKLPADITVVMGDDSKHVYRVTAKEQVPVASMDMSRYLKFSEGSPQVLHLITCGGEFDKSTRTYKDRIVITAVHL